MMAQEETFARTATAQAPLPKAQTKLAQETRTITKGMAVTSGVRLPGRMVRITQEPFSAKTLPSPRKPTRKIWKVITHRHNRMQPVQTVMILIVLMQIV